MVERISHRGPDRKDMIEDDGLAIAARKPRPSPKGAARAIVEGEGVAVASDSYLFNSELLKELFLEDSEEDAGDADLLMNMYNAVGTKMFGYLDGAFAIAISDNGRLVLARDRYGLKPMYISGGVREGTFSSEIKSSPSWLRGTISCPSLQGRSSSLAKGSRRCGPGSPRGAKVARRGISRRSSISWWSTL